MLNYLKLNCHLKLPTAHIKLPSPSTQKKIKSILLTFISAPNECQWIIDSDSSTLQNRGRLSLPAIRPAPMDRCHCTGIMIKWTTHVTMKALLLPAAVPLLRTPVNQQQDLLLTLSTSQCWLCRAGMIPRVDNKMENYPDERTTCLPETERRTPTTTTTTMNSAADGGDLGQRISMYGRWGEKDSNVSCKPHHPKLLTATALYQVVVKASIWMVHSCAQDAVILLAGTTIKM